MYFFWNQVHFLNPKDSMGTTPAKISVENFRVWIVLPKNSFFTNFNARTEKSIEAGCTQFWSFHTAHLNRPSRNISGVPLRLTWCQGFGARACQSQVTQIRAHKNRPFWDVFWTKQIFLAKRSIFAYSVFKFPESYCCKGSFRIFGDHLRASCDPSDFLYLLGSELTLLAETMS